MSCQIGFPGLEGNTLAELQFMTSTPTSSSQHHKSFGLINVAASILSTTTRTTTKGIYAWSKPNARLQASWAIANLQFGQISDLALPLIDESDMLIWEPSTSDFWKSYCRKPFSSQLFNLWLAAGMLTFMALWKARNKLSLFAPGHYKGVLDARLLASLGVAPKGGKAPRIQHVLWQPPFFPWIKVNTDGLAKGNPSPAACGGVFRDASGGFLGSFCQSLGWKTSFYSEFYAVILAIEIAHDKGGSTYG
ncbi:hypothetical protein ACLB2K_057104 [Fragaria x ananassa]